MWPIGTDYVLKERPTDQPTYEVENTQLLHANTSIPIPRIAKDWVDKNGRQFIMVDRVEGDNLQDAWATLPQNARISIAEQTVDFLQQLRKLQSEKMASIGEALLYRGWLFLQGAETPHGPFATDDELWQSLVRKLEKLPEKAQDAFRKRISPYAPYISTHGDLTTMNIMVKDGNLTAIIDWEGAGYFPAWWKYAATGIGLGTEDVEWKKLLASKMQPFDDGRVFWKNFYRLSQYPDLDDDSKELLEELLQE